MSGYKDLTVWQKSMELVTAIYLLTDQFPKEELYGISSQVKRSAVSIPSNIAEGSRRGSDKERKRFLLISFGSGAELETQIEIVKRLPFGKGLDFSSVDVLLEEVIKMLNTMTR